MQPVDLTTIVKNAIDTVQLAAAAKRIEIEVQESVALPVRGDRLPQVFWNLLNNAIKFTPAGGRIQIDQLIETNSNGIQSAQIRITDNGIGIAPEFLPQLRRIGLGTVDRQASRRIARRYDYSRERGHWTGGNLHRKLAALTRSFEH
ncbi:MAG: HAMP domain-containing histidine kinase [Leptolyngbya sp. Prado105]|nr:HAMP domain-containing histidine kinase [Leptolyngbya sp. Prado105]